MADYGFDGMVKVAFVPTIANPSAPTVAEVTAGVDLEGVLTADGVSITSDTADVDTSKLNSTANSMTIGRDTFTLSLTYVRGSHTEATEAEGALVRGAQGYIVRRTNLAATTGWAVAQKVEVYPVVCKRPSLSTPAANALQTATVGLSVTDGTKVRSFDNPAVLA